MLKKSSLKFSIWKFVFISTEMKTYVFLFLLSHIYSLWPFASFLVTTYLHPFGHIYDTVMIYSHPVRSLSVTTRLHIFGHDIYAHFRSWHIRTLWITTCLYPLDHIMFVLLDYDTFLPVRSKQIYTSSLMTFINIYNCYSVLI